MSEVDQLRLLVISDLHCRYIQPGQKDNSTRLHSNSLPNPWTRHPIEALKKIITDDKINADVILCPGDIADRSDDQGYISGYGFLKSIKLHLSAKHLISTIGNHDVDSRNLYKRTFDHIPKNLDVTYPYEDQTLVNKFWTDHFCVIQKDSFAILIFNSVYSHTGTEQASKSEIEDSVLEKMEVAIKALPADIKFRVAMCHHHPSKHYNVDYKDEDVIDKGDLLLKLLYKHDFQLLVHGHKHDPRLTYFNSLPVLCAGSFSSLQNLRELNAENVFHLITLKPRSKNGTIKSYVYGVQIGWQIKNGAYFPCHTGFGYQGDLNDLAARCLEWVTAKNQPLNNFSDLAGAISEVQNLIPEDQMKFNDALAAHGLLLTPAFPDLPHFITKLR